jgi:purine-binding chemotaxis protein CheW
MSDNRQFCTFRVDQYFLGVEVAHVQEVVRHQTITRVPLAAPEISGLINLRGQIVPTIDLRRRLGLAERTTAGQPIHVLISTSDGSASFQVDQIEEVLTVDASSLEAPPETLHAGIRRLIRGVSKQRDRLLLLLDEGQAMDLAN